MPVHHTSGTDHNPLLFFHLKFLGHCLRIQGCLKRSLIWHLEFSRQGQSREIISSVFTHLESGNIEIPHGSFIIKHPNYHPWNPPWGVPVMHCWMSCSFVVDCFCKLVAEPFCSHQRNCARQEGQKCIQGGWCAFLSTFFPPHFFKASKIVRS